MSESMESRLQEFRNNLSDLPKEGAMTSVLKYMSNEPKFMENRRNLALNELFKYLEKKSLEDKVTVLLDKIDDGSFEILAVCADLARVGRFGNAVQILELAKQERTDEINLFLNQSQVNPAGALQYLDTLFSKQPQTLNEMRPDDYKVQQILAYTAQAGMNFQQQQEFNAQYAKNELERVNQKNLQIDKAKIEVAKNRAEHDEDIHFELEKQAHAIVQPMTLGENGKPQINYDALAQDFIQQNHLVNTGSKEDPVVYHWDRENKRYIRFRTRETLTNVLNTYAYEVYGSGVDIVKSQLDSTVNKMLYNFIPQLTAELEIPKISSENQVFFKNGYYDFQQRNFVETDTSGYFHIFSLPFEYDANAEFPRVFDKMLTAMFDNDRVKKKLAYQIIGAILSNVPLKDVFVLQGVSNGGKSTFGACIKRLFSDDEVKHLGLMEEINENAKPSKKKFKLFYIDEVSQYRQSAAMKKTFSYLKTSSSGIGNPCFPEHKILMSANYQILFPTADGKDTSVENRMIVLPFAKDMKAAENDENLTAEERQEFQEAKNFLDEHFEDEKQGIVKKAFSAFQEVLEDNKQFIQKFPLNECVIGQASSDNKNSVDKIRELQEFIETNFELVDFEEFEKNPVEKGIATDKLFELVNEELPSLFGNPQSLGKAMKDVSVEGNPIETKDYKDKRYYNLLLKEEEQ